MTRRAARAGCRGCLGRTAVLLAAAALALGIIACSDGGEVVWYAVEQVTDGDTIVVRGADGRRVRIRLIGIDAPELHHPASGEQYLAREARKALERSLGARVRLVDDALAGEDRFGRRLAYVQTVDGLDAGALLLDAGLARILTKFPFAREQAYRERQRAACDAERGLWADGGLAELRWLVERGEQPIELLPMSGGRFAIRVPGWVRPATRSGQVTDAVWTARRALGTAARDPRAADAMLEEAGFVPDPTTARAEPSRAPAPRREAR